MNTLQTNYFSPDSRAYYEYYRSQAGGALPRFYGSGAQVGYGLAGIIRSLIRKIIPFGKSAYLAAKPAAKRAFKAAKPHLKAALKGAATEAASQIGRKIASQKGGGRRRRRHKPARRRRGKKAAKQHRVKKHRVKKRTRSDIISNVF